MNQAMAHFESFARAADMDRAAAAWIAERLRTRADSVIALATGRTPLGTYSELVVLHAAGAVDFARVTVFSLDELVGVAPGDPRSFRSVLVRQLLDQVKLDRTRLHSPDGSAPDREAECRRFDRRLQEAGPLDLVLLGIGRNAHIAFNEPGPAWLPDTHVARLTAPTRRDIASWLAAGSGGPRPPSGEERTGLAITMGMRPIMQARDILLLASGQDKARAVRLAFNGPITPQVPASLLQLHPSVRVLLAGQAAAAISRVAEEEAEAGSPGRT